MDLRRVKDEDKLDLCRKYFLGGFGLLPFLWVVNSIWFFKDAFIRSAFEQQPKMRQYLIGSMVGSAVWIAILTTWITIFQIYRPEWGAVGDQLSFIIPKGIP